jgi:hypothetical protein
MTLLQTPQTAFGEVGNLNGLIMYKWIIQDGRTKHPFRNQVLDQNNRAARVLPWQDTGQKINIP